MFRSSTKAICVAVTWGLGFFPAMLFGHPVELIEFLQRFEVQKDLQADLPFHEARDALFEEYVKALNQKFELAADEGDLDAALVFRGEIERAEARDPLPKSDSDDVPNALAGLRRQFRSQESRLRAERSVQRAKADALLPDQLIKLEDSLTNSGKSTAAYSVRTYRQSIEGKASKAARTIATSNPSTKTSLPPDSPFAKDSPVSGNILIKPGIHDLASLWHFTFGEEYVKESAGESPTSVVSKAGVEIMNGSVLMSGCYWNAQHTHFKNVELRGNLNSGIKAQSCLFENCSLGKGGGQSDSYWSSKWAFRDCVFSGRFLPKWSVKEVGVNAVECTFYNVTFAEVEYVDDASAESQSTWLTLQNCHFVNCMIPESLLIATDNCRFDNCTFPSDEGKLKFGSRLSVRLYTSGNLFPPQVNQNVNLNIGGTGQMAVRRGATLPHNIVGNTLSF